MNPHQEMPAAVQLAIGRLFLMGSRSEQPGDVEAYMRCRAIILDHSEHMDTTDRAPCYGRDRLKGAQGD